MDEASPQKGSGKNASARFHGFLADTSARLIAARSRLTIWLLVIGCTLCAVAINSGFGTLSFDGHLINGLNAFRDAPPGSVTSKQVGYIWAINWSAFSVLVAPPVVWFGIGALQGLNTTLANLCERGMLRTRTFKKIEYDTLQLKWQRHMEQNRMMFAFIFAAVFYLIMFDWWTTVASQILNPAAATQTVADPVHEFDWSISSLYPGSHISGTLLLVFSFVGYVVFAASVPALVISLNLCTLYYILFLATARTDDGTQVHFAAVPTELKDRHFGFKVFTDLFHNFLMMSLLILIGLWLMAMQNIYLRDMQHGDIYDMLTSDISHAANDFVHTGNFLALANWLVEPAKRMIYNPQVAWADLLFPVVSVISVLGCWLILGMKARKAQEFSREHMKALASEYHLPKGLLEERLSNDMVFWPVGWITSNQLLVLMALLFASLISYRMILLPVLLGTYVGLSTLLKYFFKKKK